MPTRLAHRLLVTATLAALAGAGCALGPTAAGRQALSQGRPAEAAEHFEDALTENPDRVDALVGLGISRYRLGDYPSAIANLDEALAKAPGEGTARFYLALGHLRKGDDARAAEQLAAVRRLPLEPRLAAFVDRARELVRGGTLTGELRAHLAADLEDAAAWSRELAETRQALANTRFAYDPFFHRPYYIIRCRRC